MQIPSLTLVTVCVLLVQSSAFAQADADKKPGVLTSSSGRFVFGQISQVRRDQFMLDTQSGRLWRMACDKNSESDATQCAQLALEPIPYYGEYLGGRSYTPPKDAPQRK